MRVLSLLTATSDDIYTGKNATDNPNAGKALHFHRFASPGHSAFGYFLDTNTLADVSVNSQTVAAGSVAGPLQDFSIIEIGTAVIFWWRSQIALTTWNPTKTIEVSEFAGETSCMWANF